MRDIIEICNGRSLTPRSSLARGCPSSCSTILHEIPPTRQWPRRGEARPQLLGQEMVERERETEAWCWLVRRSLCSHSSFICPQCTYKCSGLPVCHRAINCDPLSSYDAFSPELSTFNTVRKSGVWFGISEFVQG